MGLHHMHSLSTHKLVVEKVYELLSDGSIDVQGVKQALKHSVQHTLCPDVQPDLTNCVYYSTTTYVHNHIYRAQHIHRLNKD